jgi:two-component system, NtrC family, nitrogen regulation sensor histidine kinase GlnL
MTNLKPTLRPDLVLPAPEWTAMSAQLAASLAHEIRNPLLSIRGAAQLLEQSVGAEDKSLARLIMDEAMRIEELIARLDPLTPTPQHAPEAINIHEITEYVRLAAQSSFAAEVKFVTQYDPSLPPVTGHRAPLIQAVMNLVKNAAEAVRGVEDPTITLRTRYMIGDRMRRAGGRTLPIHLRVEDNGPGIPVDLAPRLFTPFSSGREGGKGLGLAIVARLMEEQGGLVALESAPGKPAIFSLYLPQG